MVIEADKTLFYLPYMLTCFILREVHQIATPMKNNQDLNTSNIAIAFLTMGVIAVSALAFRPQGSINIDFGKNPSLTIGENPKAIQR